MSGRFPLIYSFFLEHYVSVLTAGSVKAWTCKSDCWVRSHRKPPIVRWACRSRIVASFRGAGSLVAMEA